MPNGQYAHMFDLGSMGFSSADPQTPTAIAKRAGKHAPPRTNDYQTKTTKFASPDVIIKSKSKDRTPKPARRDANARAQAASTTAPRLHKTKKIFNTATNMMTP